MHFRPPAAAAAILASVLCAKPPLPSFVTTPSGLRFVDMRKGQGPAPEAGQVCSVLFRGWLYNNSRRGVLYASVQDRRKPFLVTLGQGEAIPGLEEGIKTMRAGGKRLLIVPPALGYGKQGKDPSVPPDSTLLLEVELLNIK